MHTFIIGCGRNKKLWHTSAHVKCVRCCLILKSGIRLICCYVFNFLLSMKLITLLSMRFFFSISLFCCYCMKWTSCVCLFVINSQRKYIQCVTFSLEHASIRHSGWYIYICFCALFFLLYVNDLHRNFYIVFTQVYVRVFIFSFSFFFARPFALFVIIALHTTVAGHVSIVSSKLYFLVYYFILA